MSSSTGNQSSLGLRNSSNKLIVAINSNDLVQNRHFEPLVEAEYRTNGDYSNFTIDKIISLMTNNFDYNISDTNVSISSKISV